MSLLPPSRSPLRRRDASTPHTTPHPTPPGIRRLQRLRRWSVLIIALGVISGVLGRSAWLLVIAHPDLLDWIIVGGVLVVVFGTPLLCLLAVLVFYVWALARLGRQRTHPARHADARLD